MGDIVPGQVLILLAGRHRGKRVTFLKTLESGLLLVTGPYKTNGVPLKRVNQRYCIGTKTSVGDLSKLDLSKFTDDYFKRQKNFDSKIKLDGTMKKYLKARFALTNACKPHEM